MTKIGTMFALSPQLKKSFCLTVAIILFWLGGLGCALCCATMVMKACCDEEEIYPTAMALSHEESEQACCMAMEPDNTSSQDSAISKRASFKGCMLLPHNEISTAVFPHIFNKEVIAPISSGLVLLNNFAIDIKPATVYPSPPARNNTYLRCCVLLI